MADIEHLGIGINTNIDYKSLTDADKKTKKFISDLGVLEQRFNKLKVPDTLPTQLGKINGSLTKTVKSVDELKSHFNGIATAGENTARRVSDATKKNTAEIDRYKDSLKGLSSTGTDTAGKVKDSLDKTNESTKRLIEANQRLKSSITGVGNSANSMNGLSPTIWKAGDSAKSASKSFDAAKGSVDKTTDSLKRNTTASESTTSSFGRLHEAGSKLVSVGSAISAAMVPVAMAFKTANSEATKLADEYNVIKNLQETGGDSAATARRNTAAIRKENENLSVKYGVDQQSLANGSEELIRRGYSGRQDLAAHKYFVQAARATKEHYNQIVDAAAPMLEQFGYKKRAGNSVKRMARYTREVLNKAAYVGDTTSGEVGGEGGFGSSFKMAGSILHQNGQSLSSSLAVLGTLSNYGEEGTSAGTGVRQIVSSLIGASKSKSKTAALKDLGLTPDDFFNRNGDLKQLPTVFEMLNRATRGKQSKRVASDFQKLFGQTGFNDASILTKNYRDVQSNVRAANRADSTNYITKLANRNMQSLENQTARTRMLLKKVGMEFAKEIAPGLSKVLQFVNKILIAMEGWPAPVKKTLGYITAITGAISTGVVAKKLVGNVLGIGGKTAGKVAGKDDGLVVSLAKRIGTGIAKAPGDTALQRAINYTSAKVAPKSTAAIPFSQRWQLQNSGFAFPKGASKTSLIRGLTGEGGAGIVATSGIDLFKALTAKNPTSKFKNYGKSLGSAIGGGVGLFFGGPGGAAIGTMIGQVAGGWAGKMAQKFSKTKFGKSVAHTFKQTVWSVKQSLRPLSGIVSSTVKSVNRSFSSMGREISSTWRDINRNKDFRTFKNFIKSGLMASLKFTIKTVGTLLKGAVGVVKGVMKALSASIKGIVGVVHGVVKTVSDIVHGRWGKVWKDLGGIAKSAIDGIRGVLKGLQEAWNSTVGTMLKMAKNVWDFVSGKDWKTPRHTSSTSVKDANAAVKRMQNGQGARNHAPKARNYSVAANNARIAHLSAHANGTASLVGEAGPELAYKPYANKARILGAHGPQLAKIQSGEKILNARDTAKVMQGGLGKGLILNGYANGTASLSKTKKTVTSDYKDITDKSTKSLDKLTKANKSAFSKISSTAKKESSQTRKSTVSDFTSLTGKVNKQTDKTRRNTVSDYTNMRKGSIKQMDAMHKGVVDTAEETSKGFGKAMGKMDNYAHSAMSNTVDQLNKGISSIDKVLDQFGGNSTVIKPIHFASGTNGELKRNTLAMVNDASVGPRQEAVVKKSGSIYFPRGSNRTLMLEKGDQVLNGYQTQELARSMGLVHFAKGSGVSKSALQKIADKASANPDQAFTQMFASKISPSGPDLQKGTVNFAKSGSTKYGNPWSAAMWNVIEDAIGGANGHGGTREAFLKYAESTFHGVRYLMGAASKSVSDCSGMVMQALRHFGINIGRTTVAMQNSSGVQYLGKSLSKTVPGDLVIFGHSEGAGGHVGIIKNPRTGTMFNETPPYARVTDIASDKSMGYGYYRVRGLHNAKPTKEQATVSKSLTELAKRELGSSALKWIKNNLSEDDGSGLMAGKAVGDHGHWMKQAHIPERDWAAINYIVSAESGWNPHITNPSSGTYGLGQMQGYNLHYYTRHGSKDNPVAQLMGIMDYIHERYGSVAHAVAFRKAHNWYATGGDATVGDTVMVGEHGPELAQFKQPVHIYSNDQTRQRLKPLSAAKRVRPIRRTKSSGSSRPITVNVNINGNVEGTETQARKLSKIIGDEVERRLTIILNQIGDDLGVDDSFY
ncbi:phage tail tape measure protein [uncultured Lactobacillus sp.]|uniref:phage tail tape measure protein n=1 Tax=uncultured Lactobacillus sp. TaxID=153152 RepID=UPI00258AFC1D|nr:phage tail tape measure protein [uncultured Lactobacillus sp.]